jgi:hypothetical protein
MYSYMLNSVREPENSRKEAEKIKLDIKTWERGFQIEFGRTPTSADIKTRDKIRSYHKISPK